jgi:hypothetical protein
MRHLRANVHRLIKTEVLTPLIAPTNTKVLTDTFV